MNIFKVYPRRTLATLSLAAFGLLVGCSESERTLKGDRIDARLPLGMSSHMVSGPDSSVVRTVDLLKRPNSSRTLNVPPMEVVTTWSHINGNPSHLAVHSALPSQLDLAWSVSIGEGNSRKHRLTASPVVAGETIFAMDSKSKVSAVSSDGDVIWSAKLIPPFENADDVSGGGLAYGDGILFVTTGFGELYALDSTTGQVRWVQELGAPAMAPTVAGDLVFVVTRDSKAWAVEVAGGRLRWSWVGAEAAAGSTLGASPAFAENAVYLAYPSGEIGSIDATSGLLRWIATFASSGASVKSSITAITGAPVVAGEVLYATKQVGKTVAIDVGSGNILWSVFEGSSGPVLPVGDSVFLVSDLAQLIRLEALGGDLIWSVKLPDSTRGSLLNSGTAILHFGPVLAGGQLMVVSSDGQIRRFDPTDGDLISTTRMRSGAAMGPVIVDGTLYVLANDGTLNAYR